MLVEGKLLQGEALLEYAQQKGLCPKCVQHVTHKRVRKRLGMLRYTFDWIPLTVTDEQAGNYSVSVAWYEVTLAGKTPALLLDAKVAEGVW